MHVAPAMFVRQGYRHRYLGGAADLSKFLLAMEGGVYPVIGAMPAGFDFPPGVAAWIPRELEPETPGRTAHNWRGLGRLRDGITVPQARANLSAIAHRLRDEYGGKVVLSAPAALPLAHPLVGDVPP